MILGFFETLEDYANKAGKYIENNFDNPIFWIIIFAILLVIGIIGIQKFWDK